MDCGSFCDFSGETSLRHEATQPHLRGNQMAMSIDVLLWRRLGCDQLIEVGHFAFQHDLSIWYIGFHLL